MWLGGRNVAGVYDLNSLTSILLIFFFEFSIFTIIFLMDHLKVGAKIEFSCFVVPCKGMNIC